MEKYTCEHCGSHPRIPIDVGGKIYCDDHCLFAADPHHAYFYGRSDMDTKQSDIIARMRALKKEADEAGVTWIS